MIIAGYGCVRKCARGPGATSLCDPAALRVTALEDPGAEASSSTNTPFDFGFQARILCLFSCQTFKVVGTKPKTQMWPKFRAPGG